MGTQASCLHPASAPLSRSFPHCFPKHQTHQPCRHGPDVTVDIAFNHHAARIVQASLNHGYRRVILFVRPADQVGVWICFQLYASRSKRQSNLSCAHENLSGDDHALLYLDYDAVKEVVLIYRACQRDYGSSKLRSHEHNENSRLNLAVKSNDANRNPAQRKFVVSNTN